MAFGKNPNAMNIAGSFRQMSGQLAKNTYEKRTKGNIPAFLDEYKPDQSNTDTVRLIPGEYLQYELVERNPPGPDPDNNPDDKYQLVTKMVPFIKYGFHYDGFTEKGAICSAGPWKGFRTKRAPCHGCDIYLETLTKTSTGRWESSRMGQQDKFAICVWDYGNYHKLEQYEKDTGKVKVNPRTNEPYYNWVKCLGQVCDACRAQKETQSGMMRHWPLSWTQLQVLRSSEVDIGKSCTVCSKTDCIYSLGWECTQLKEDGTVCGECAIDMSTTQLQPAELLKMTDEPYTCASCGNAGFLREVYECRSCAPQGAQGVRASLFDVDLRVKLIAMPTSTGTKGKGKSLQVQGWSTPYNISPQLAELAKPIDLVARYAPDSLERQAENFQVAANTGPRREPQTGGVPAPQGAAAPAPQGGGPVRQYANPYAPKATQ